MKIYLAGPIFGCSDDACKDWRQYAKDSMNAETLDPMSRDYRGKEDAAFREIVEGDKEDIVASDALLVYAKQPSFGTAMEILFAWNIRKPVVCVVGPKVSPWVRYHSTKTFEQLEEAIQYINDEMGRGR